MRQGIKHNIKENKSYYLTMTIVDWVDLFTRKAQRDIFIASLKYCIEQKGLNVYAYWMMSNHIHLIVNNDEPFLLRDTVRDLKKFTSKAFVQEIINGKESRRDWLIELFQKHGAQDPKNKTFKVWQSGNHVIELYSESFTWDKINYIHRNPVEAGFVSYPTEWLYSSASNYAKKEYLILPEVICISPRQITVMWRFGLEYRRVANPAEQKSRKSKDNYRIYFKTHCHFSIPFLKESNDRDITLVDTH